MLSLDGHPIVEEGCKMAIDKLKTTSTQKFTVDQATRGSNANKYTSDQLARIGDKTPQIVAKQAEVKKTYVSISPIGIPAKDSPRYKAYQYALFREKESEKGATFGIGGIGTSRLAELMAEYNAKVQKDFGDVANDKLRSGLSSSTIASLSDEEWSDDNKLNEKIKQINESKEKARGVTRGGAAIQPVSAVDREWFKNYKSNYRNLLSRIVTRKLGDGTDKENPPLYYYQQSGAGNLGQGFTGSAAGMGDAFAINQALTAASDYVFKRMTPEEKEDWSKSQKIIMGEIAISRGDSGGGKGYSGGGSKESKESKESIKGVSIEKNANGEEARLGGVLVGYEGSSRPGGGQSGFIGKETSKGAVGLASLSPIAQIAASVAGGTSGLTPEGVKIVNEVRKESGNNKLSGESLAAAVYKKGDISTASVIAPDKVSVLLAEDVAKKDKTDLSEFKQLNSEVKEKNKISDLASYRKYKYGDSVIKEARDQFANDINVFLAKDNPAEHENNLKVALEIYDRYGEFVAKQTLLSGINRVTGFTRSENPITFKDGTSVKLKGQVFSVPMGEYAKVTAPGISMQIMKDDGWAFVFRNPTDSTLLNVLDTTTNKVMTWAEFNRAYPSLRSGTDFNQYLARAIMVKDEDTRMPTITYVTIEKANNMVKTAKENKLKGINTKEDDFILDVANRMQGDDLRRQIEEYKTNEFVNIASGIQPTEVPVVVSLNSVEANRLLKLALSPREKDRTEKDKRIIEIYNKSLATNNGYRLDKFTEELRQDMADNPSIYMEGFISQFTPEGKALHPELEIGGKVAEEYLLKKEIPNAEGLKRIGESEVLISLEDLKPLRTAGITTDLFVPKSQSQIVVESSTKVGKSEDVGGPDELRGQNIAYFEAMTSPDVGSGKGKTPVLMKYAMIKGANGEVVGLWYQQAGEGWKTGNYTIDPKTKEVTQMMCSGPYCGNMAQDLRDGIKYVLKNDWNVGVAPSVVTEIKPKISEPVVSENVTQFNPIIEKPKTPSEFKEWQEWFNDSAKIIGDVEDKLYAGRDVDGNIFTITKDQYDKYSDNTKKIFNDYGVAGVIEYTNQVISGIDKYKNNDGTYDIFRYAEDNRNNGISLKNIEESLRTFAGDREELNKVVDSIIESLPTDNYISDREYNSLGEQERINYNNANPNDPRVKYFSVIGGLGTRTWAEAIRNIKYEGKTLTMEAMATNLSSVLNDWNKNISDKFNDWRKGIDVITANEVATIKLPQNQQLPPMAMLFPYFAPQYLAKKQIEELRNNIVGFSLWDKKAVNEWIDSQRDSQIQVYMKHGLSKEDAIKRVDEGWGYEAIHESASAVQEIGKMIPLIPLMMADNFNRLLEGDKKAIVDTAEEVGALTVFAIPNMAGSISTKIAGGKPGLATGEAIGYGIGIVVGPHTIIKGVGKGIRKVADVPNTVSQSTMANTIEIPMSGVPLKVGVGRALAVLQTLETIFKDGDFTKDKVIYDSTGKMVTRITPMARAGVTDWLHVTNRFDEYVRSLKDKGSVDFEIASRDSQFPGKGAYAAPNASVRLGAAIEPSGNKTGIIGYKFKFKQVPKEVQDIYNELSVLDESKVTFDVVRDVVNRAVEKYLELEDKGSLVGGTYPVFKTWDRPNIEKVLNYLKDNGVNLNINPKEPITGDKLKKFNEAYNKIPAQKKLELSEWVLEIEAYRTNNAPLYPTKVTVDSRIKELGDVSGGSYMRVDEDIINSAGKLSVKGGGKVPIMWLSEEPNQLPPTLIQKMEAEWLYEPLANARRIFRPIKTKLGFGYGNIRLGEIEGLEIKHYNNPSDYFSLPRRGTSIIRNPQNRDQILVGRAKEETHFDTIGGSNFKFGSSIIESGEAPIEISLVREAIDEGGVIPTGGKYVGQMSGRHMNTKLPNGQYKEGERVFDIYEVDYKGQPVASSEIDTLAWYDGNNLYSLDGKRISGKVSDITPNLLKYANNSKIKIDVKITEPQRALVKEKPVAIRWDKEQQKNIIVSKDEITQVVMLDESNNPINSLSVIRQKGQTIAEAIKLELDNRGIKSDEYSYISTEYKFPDNQWSEIIPGTIVDTYAVKVSNVGYGEIPQRPLELVNNTIGTRVWKKFNPELTDNNVYISGELSDKARNQIYKIQSKLKEEATKQGWDFIKWQEPDKYHITLRYIGKMPKEDLPKLAIAIDKINQYVKKQSIKFDVSGWETWPNAKDVNIVSLRMKDVGNMDKAYTLQRIVDAASTEAGLSPATYKFEPHITLLEIGDNVPITKKMEVGGYFVKNRNMEVIPVDELNIKVKEQGYGDVITEGVQLKEATPSVLEDVGSTGAGEALVEGAMEQRVVSEPYIEPKSIIVDTYQIWDNKKIGQSNISNYRIAEVGIDGLPEIDNNGFIRVFNDKGNLELVKYNDIKDNLMGLLAVPYMKIDKGLKIYATPDMTIEDIATKFRDPNAIDSIKISKAQLPEELYHVTTDVMGIDKTGKLTKLPSKGGLGGGEVERSISFTTDKNKAEQLRKDLIAVIEVSKLPLDKVDDYLLNLAKQDKFEIKPENITQDALLKSPYSRYYKINPTDMDWKQYKLNYYFNARENIAKIENPVFLRSLEYYNKLDSNNVGIVTINSNQIPDALITKLPLLDEVRVYGEVPIQPKEIMSKVEVPEKIVSGVATELEFKTYHANAYKEATGKDISAEQLNRDWSIFKDNQRRTYIVDKMTKLKASPQEIVDISLINHIPEDLVKKEFERHGYVYGGLRVQYKAPEFVNEATIEGVRRYNRIPEKVLDEFDRVRKVGDINNANILRNELYDEYGILLHEGRYGDIPLPSDVKPEVVKYLAESKGELWTFEGRKLQNKIDNLYMYDIYKDAQLRGSDRVRDLVDDIDAGFIKPTRISSVLNDVAKELYGGELSNYNLAKLSKGYRNYRKNIGKEEVTRFSEQMKGIDKKLENLVDRTSKGEITDIEISDWVKETYPEYNRGFTIPENQISSYVDSFKTWVKDLTAKDTKSIGREIRTKFDLYNEAVKNAKLEDYYKGTKGYGEIKIGTPPYIKYGKEYTESEYKPSTLVSYLKVQYPNNKYPPYPIGEYPPTPKYPPAGEYPPIPQYPPYGKYSPEQKYPPTPKYPPAGEYPPTVNPPPIPPRTTKPPAIIKSRRSWEDLTEQEKTASIVWKQGFWHWALVPPFTQKDLIGSKEPFAGTKIHHGPKAAYKSVARVQGSALPEKITVDLGIMDISFVQDKDGKDVKVYYVADPMQRTKSGSVEGYPQAIVKRIPRRYSQTTTQVSSIK